MTPPKKIRLALLLLLCWGSPGSLAQEPTRTGDLTTVDWQFMAQQRETMQALAMMNLGRQFSGDRKLELALLQALLDKQLVRPDQVRELQAMGVIMDDLLAAELGMRWVLYEDNVGRSRALRYQKSDNVLFPMTMIARRREVGNQTSVVNIYQKASDIIANSTPALPFQ
tara:strand:+ start:107 stop:613 length:507 start_codon:yes stop_codon:yes gene_type:complete